MGLRTLLGARAQGFFIPYRYAADLSRQAGSRPYPAMEAVFAVAVPRFEETMSLLERYGADLTSIGRKPAPAPRFEQDWFPRLDAAVAYTMIRARRPKRLVEVGSGHSTRFFVRAATDEGTNVDLTAIDPAPRADCATLPVRLIRSTIQEVGRTPFAGLGAGDTVSIDSSHILMPGTDVDVLLNRVLPELPPGVLVHIHDMFLPHDYPPAWAWRAYNEQLGVAALLHGGAWRVLWSSQYVLRHCPEVMNGSIVHRLPLWPGAFESSLWLEKIRLC
ncbi:MAG: class I SAM-dependent methyltransferase [Hyphomicrobiales bacterium]|nr:class I SAM-dependent methyltransferase [Hyphomicrobiales bacterium]